MNCRQCSHSLGVCQGIGVPLLFAYVYGVVPISLCRSGCGVSTTDTGGVRIDFDESDVPVETVVSPFAGKTLHMLYFVFLCIYSDIAVYFIGSVPHLKSFVQYMLDFFNFVLHCKYEILDLLVSFVYFRL